MRRQVQIAHLKYAAITHATLRRYRLSVKKFFAWPRSSKLRLPHSFAELGVQLSEYFNFLFLDDCPMHWAADSLSGFRRLLPSCKRHLNTCGLYYKNWTKCLMRERAIPLSAELVQGMAAAVVTKQKPRLAVSFLLAFLGLLRVSEVLSISVSSLIFFVPTCFIICVPIRKGQNAKAAPRRFKFLTRK